jgi:hypothetical protein
MSNSTNKQKNEGPAKGANCPNNPEKQQHRLEAITYVFLSIWITADILVAYGHTSLALWFFYGALSLPLYLLAHHTGIGWPKWKSIVVYILVIVLSILPVVLYVISRIASFSVEGAPIIYARPLVRDGGIPLFLCVHLRHIGGKEAETEASPVYVLVYVRVTNEREAPVFIDGFSVEGKSKTGVWERMPAFDMEPQLGGEVQFYMLTETSKGIDFALEHAKRIDFKGAFLQTRLAEKPLNPHEPVQGWVMLDIPSNGLPDYPPLRFSMGIAGKIITRPIKAWLTNASYMDIEIVKPQPILQGTEIRDLRSVPLRFYEDGSDFDFPKK